MSCSNRCKRHNDVTGTRLNTHPTGFKFSRTVYTAGLGHSWFADCWSPTRTVILKLTALSVAVAISTVSVAHEVQKENRQEDDYRGISDSGSFKVTEQHPESARASVAQGGRWSAVDEWPVLAVHANLLPNGKVLAWDATPDDFDEDPHTASTTTTRVTVWDPVMGTHTHANNDTDTDLFCAGSAHLWDGRVLFAGGDGEPSGRNGPLTNTNVYDPTTNSWSRLPNMHAARWYSSVIPLENGEMLTLGGSYAPTPLAEVFQLDQQWRALNLLPPYSLSGDYQWFQSATDGDVLYFGPHDLLSTIDTSNNGHWEVESVRDGNGYRGYGSYAMYQPDRILVAGGGDSWRSSVVVNAESKRATETSDMHFGRRQHNLTILADGSVLATGGNFSGSELVDKYTGVLEPEIWNPESGRWQLMNPMAIDRQYHSIALLLPDGRVLSAGGGYCGVCSFLGYHEQNAEVFSPPYLFDSNGELATRPRIVSSPQKVNYDERFEVRVDSDAAIEKAHLIKLGSVTHSQNQDQRLVPLAIQQNGNRLSLLSPAGRTVAPPGHYMLFIIRGGVPSISTMVQVGQPRLASNQAVKHAIERNQRQWFEVLASGESAYLSVVLSELQSNVDLLVAADQIPERTSSDDVMQCAPRSAGTDDELCNVSLSNAGRWYVGVEGGGNSSYTLAVRLSDQPVASAGELSGNALPRQIPSQRQQLLPSQLDNPSIPPRVWSRVYSSTDAELFWESSRDNGFVSGYEVFRNGVLFRRLDARSLYLSDLQPGVSYNYEIRAVDNEDKRSGFTAPHAVNTASLQPAPDTVLAPAAALPSGDQVPQVPVVTIPDSTVASVVIEQPTDVTPPGVPDGLRSLVYSATAAEVFWNASTGDRLVVGYEVYRDGQPLGRIDGRSLYQTDLQAGQRYVYRIRAIDDQGNVSAFSESLTVAVSAISNDDVSPQSVSQPQNATSPDPVLSDPIAANDTNGQNTGAVAPSAQQPEEPQDEILLRLINARTNQIVAGYEDIDDGDEISLQQAGENQLNIEAFVTTQVGNISRVQFDFNGRARFRNESFFPYALFGDHSGDFIGVPLGIGSQSLDVTVYVGNRAALRRSVEFNIVQ